MKPARKKELADWLKSVFSISSSRTCRLSGLVRSIYYYRVKPEPINEVLTKRIKELSASRVRFGFQRIHVMPRREGWQVNRKRVHRLYREQKLQLRRKKRRIIASSGHHTHGLRRSGPRRQTSAGRWILLPTVWRTVAISESLRWWINTHGMPSIACRKFVGRS